MRSLILVLIFAVVGSTAAARNPNFILFLVDDLGWTDLGCMGSDLYETPNIDRLAADGVKFLNAYSACTVCSPTRAAILTGQYPARLRVTDFIAGHPFHNTRLRIPNWTKQLNLEHLTIAEELKRLNYRSAHIGKWHLTPRDGVEHPDLWPEKQGFDRNIGGFSAGAPGSYHWPYGGGKNRASRKVINLPNMGKEGDYLTDTLTDEAVKIIRDWHDKPFFIYFSYYNVHTPIQAKKPYAAKVRQRMAAESKIRRHTNADYAAMIQSVDESIGRVRAELKRQGLAKETVLIFTSDNGGLLRQGATAVTSNLPARNGKGSVYEGGVRVPGIIHWPGVTPAGTVSKFPIISMDFMPTILGIAGLNPTRRMDGRNLVPLLRHNEPIRRDDLFWHYPHYHSMGGVPYTAVLSGDWRLIEFHDGKRLELYNLNDDPHEDRNLAKSNPVQAKRMVAKINRWRDSVGAQMPAPNPEYDPSEPTVIRFGTRERTPAPFRRN
ncbi:MAG: sulfatase [Verrucomicrobiales bacterium]|nr:sulfatase [Verrucomicrobiales bacterium]|tara:strand:+ start:1925 stop:3400 length:1476 start_codon:yes stop_codon:yes gene_type:complete